MRSDTRVEAYPVDDVLGLQAFDFRVCVEFVEETHTQGKVGVGEKFDRLSLLHPHK